MTWPLIVLFLGVFGAVIVSSTVRYRRVVKRPGYLEIGPKGRDRL